jgi:hypothetical protein
MEFAPALFTTRIGSARRTFYFDVKNTKDSKPYIKITESSIGKEGEKRKIYMTVFENEITDFKQAIEQVLGFIQQQPK